jgi:hypothetical protein
MNKLGFLAVLAGLLVGCTQPPLPVAAPTVAYPPMTIVRGPRPVDAGAEAFRDIGRYLNFTPRMLLDEVIRLDGQADADPYVGLRQMVLLWLLDRPESAARLEALASRLSHDSDPRVATPARTLANTVSSQRRLTERNNLLETKIYEAQRRIDQLTAKIEALKSLEKELLSRPEPKLDAPQTPRTEAR